MAAESDEEVARQLQAEVNMFLFNLFLQKAQFPRIINFICWNYSYLGIDTLHKHATSCDRPVLLRMLHS